MSEPVAELLEEFAARRARGERPDPLDFLRRAGAGADLLADRIDRLVQSVPPPPPAADDTARMRAMLDAEPPLLSLRLGRRLRIQAVAEALCAALGLPAAAAGRVRRRYHELEAGGLDPARLDRRLRAALAAVLEVPEWRLPAGPGDAVLGSEAVPMARDARADRAWHALAGPPEMSAGAAYEPDPRGDVDAEVDRLFGVG